MSHYRTQASKLTVSLYVVLYYPEDKILHSAEKQQ